MSKANPFIRERILLAVTREREYQDNKWGTIQEHPHSIGGWILIMQSELQEAADAWCKGDELPESSPGAWRKGDGDAAALREILQVIAVGFACLEQHDIVERG